MMYHIGFPTDSGKLYDCCVYKVYSKKCEILLPCLQRNNFYNEIGLTNVSEFLKNMGHKINLGAEVFSSNEFKDIALQFITRDVGVTGTSNSAAYILSAFQEKKPKEEAPLVLISIDLNYPENKEPSLKNLGSYPESLIRKLEASQKAKAIALVLHEKDAQKLKDKVKDNKKLAEKTQFISLSKDVFKKAKVVQDNKILVVGCKTDELFLLAEALGIKLHFVNKEKRDLIKSATTLAIGGIVGAAITNRTEFIARFFGGRFKTYRDFLEYYYAPEFLAWAKDNPFLAPHDIDTAFSMDGSPLVKSPCLSIGKYCEIVEMNMNIIRSWLWTIDFRDDVKGGMANETVEYNIDRKSFLFHTYIIPESSIEYGKNFINEQDLYQKGVNCNKMKIIVVKDNFYAKALRGKAESQILKMAYNRKEFYLTYEDAPGTRDQAIRIMDRKDHQMLVKATQEADKIGRHLVI